MELRTAGAYLPGVLLFILYTNHGKWWTLVLGVLALLAAVAIHGAIRHLFGPGGPEANPLAKSTGTQRVLVLMTTVGPANRFVDNYLDTALNAPGYWNLLSRRRVGFFMVVGVLAVVILPVATGAALLSVFPHLHEASFTVGVLYIALVVWLLQNFVVWGQYPAVYVLERDTGHGYQSTATDDRFTVTTDPPRPNHPAPWMHLDAPTEVAILQVLAHKSVPVSAHLVAFYLARDTATVNPPLDVVVAFREMWGRVDDVTARLDGLVAHGLATQAGPYLYQLTEVGHAYLVGEVPATAVEPAPEDIGE
jgi:hypothetical protein